MTYINAIDIRRGSSEDKYQFYHIIGADETQNQIVITFKCFSNYSALVENAFSKLIPVHFIIDAKEEKKENDNRTEPKPEPESSELPG